MNVTRSQIDTSKSYVPCTQRFSYTRCIQRYTNLCTLSLIPIFAPLVSCCSSPAKRLQLHTAALPHEEVWFTGLNLCLDVSAVLSGVDSTPNTDLQLSELDPAFPGKPFSVAELEVRKPSQPPPGAERYLEEQLWGDLSPPIGLPLPAWEDQFPPTALPACIPHSQLLLISCYFCRSSGPFHNMAQSINRKKTNAFGQAVCSHQPQVQQKKRAASSTAACL